MNPTLSTRLVGERLLLRPPGTSDIPAFRRLLIDNADHLRPWSPVAPSGSDPMSYVDLTKAVARQRSLWREDRSYAFLIESLHGSQLIGRLVLSDILRGAAQHATLGYWIAGKQQGQGFTTEAVRLALAFAFETLKLHRVQAATMPINVASRRVLAKTGFREEGVAVGYLQIAGSWADHILHALTAEEWNR